METREITTQAELDALPRGVIAVVRSGYFDAYGSASVRAYGSASVRAYGSASVRAYDSASVSAYDSASVRAYDSASVRAYGSASVRAYDSASVRAYDSASVRAYDSASVRAYGVASVRASKGVSIHKHYGHKGKLTGGVVIDVPDLSGCDAATWLDWYGVTVTKAGYAVLFKAVNEEWQTGRGPAWTYKPGSTVVAADFKPSRSCGQGLHLCAAPHLSQRYLEGATRFVAVKVKAADVIPLGDKVKVPACTVLHSVNEHGRKL